MNGILKCARYAFAPNFYQYCGPDENKLLKEYLKKGRSDIELSCMLNKFNTLSSYLKKIAYANNIKDEFDKRVVESYWIGNDLLKQVSAKDTYNELLFGQNLKKKISKKDLKWTLTKIPQGVFLHHSFHVFNVFVRTGHHALSHTTETMDNCRIGWGKVEKIENGKLKVESQKVIYKNGKLKIEPGIVRTIETAFASENLKKGDLVTYHWGWMCEKITKKQAEQLKYYTKLHLKMANRTI